VDFSELSHTVAKGNYAGFKGKLLGKTSEGNVTFCLLINPRGKPVKEATEIVVHESFLTGVNSNDMIALVGVGVEGQEEEDPKLVAYEKTTWMCNKCNGVNSNDGSMCINLVGGKVCAAIKPSDGNILGWGDCFKVSCVIFFVLICIRLSVIFVLTSLSSPRKLILCQTQPQQRDQGEWICAVCRLKMGKDDTKCIVCETPKPETSTVALADNIDKSKDEHANMKQDDDKNADAADGVQSISEGMKNYTISSTAKRQKLS
jgi:hypothetical protein